MKIEEKYMDLLQNMEFGIVSIYREEPELTDVQVNKALDALISHTRAIAARRTPTERDLSDLETLVFERVFAVLELREDMKGQEEEQPRRRFSRAAFKQQTKEDIYVACFRRIQKSIKLWSKERGIRGYLDYVKNFIH